MLNLARGSKNTSVLVRVGHGRDCEVVGSQVSQVTQEGLQLGE